ncbi:MAG TPA: hypothetical protein DD381_14065 [Lentisphaeria bacterium]|nr:MAG: hypothetical protein A2X47_01200 [Lentisphaerae bacterium GWF2_38_69]HBM17449.1 hypothetical protein [Lentisphaeria bacterium]
MKITTLEHLNSFIKKAGQYFRYADVKAFLISQNTKVSDSTLQTYLSREIAKKNIFSAGKGWYSKQEKEFRLNVEPIQKIIGLIKQKFPLLEISCWSTEQINSFTHHMLGKHITFIYVDIDAVNSVHEFLLDNGYNSYDNPTKKETQKHFRATNNTVVLRASIAKQPEDLSGASSVEKLLVDLIFENRKLHIMPEDEIENIFESILKYERINVSTLFSYAKRREMDIQEIKKFRIFNLSGNP